MVYKLKMRNLKPVHTITPCLFKTRIHVVLTYTKAKSIIIAEPFQMHIKIVASRYFFNFKTFGLALDPSVRPVLLPVTVSNT